MFFSMPQALENKRSKNKLDYDAFGCLVIDECHHTPAKTWYDVAMKCRAPHRFALSATPFELEENGLHLRAAVSDYYHTVTYEESYAAGYLSRPNVRMMYYDSGEVHIQKGAIGTYWTRLYEFGVADHLARNMAILKEAERYIRKGFPPLILVRLVDKHAIPLLRMAEKRFKSYRVKLITGGNSVSERVSAIEELVEKRTIDVLISTKILGEGQDIPDLAALVNGVGGYSPIQTMQIAGRVMRPKSPAFLSDFVDTQQKTLQGHSELRRDAYRKMGARVVYATV
jgi:superfamily II DNA or RNA helicase